jgi:hypothetical protein
MYSAVNGIFHFSYFDPDYATFVLTVVGLARVYSIWMTPVWMVLALALSVEVLSRVIPVPRD